MRWWMREIKSGRQSFQTYKAWIDEHGECEEVKQSKPYRDPSEPSSSQDDEMIDTLSAFNQLTPTPVDSLNQSANPTEPPPVQP